MSEQTEPLVTVFIMTHPDNRRNAPAMAAFHDMLKERYGLEKSICLRTLGIVQGSVQASLMDKIRDEADVVAVVRESEFHPA